jgi:tripartite-type tricarboxylate transporter receptor subunit TctC
VRKLPYDAINGFTHIAMIGGTPNVLVISPTLPVKTVKEFVSYLKANPSKVNYGSAGQGTLTHLVMEQFKEDTDTEMMHAAYRGIGPAIVDVMAGQTQAMVPGLAAALPHIKAGKLKPIAITGTQRHALLPDVPTFEELGYTGFTGLQWYGIMGPANMPKELVTRLNAEINKQIGTPALKEKLAHEAVETMPMSPAQFTDYVKNDIGKWTALVKSRKLELQ